MSGPYEVIAVRYGTRTTSKRDCYLHYDSYGEPDAPLEMDYFFWVLHGGSETIVVDTGFEPAVGVRRGRTVLCPPVDALAKIGVDPATVSRLVLTHLHYDHTGNVTAFPDAELIVQERELDFWIGPNGSLPLFAAHAEAAELAHIAGADRDGRVRRLRGSESIAPGISAVLVGGHTPGQQLLVVEAHGGPVVLASDTVHYYEELELARPFQIVVDLEEMYAGYDTVNELAARPGAVLVPGHDPEVTERFGALEGAGGLAFRIA